MTSILPRPRLPSLFRLPARRTYSAPPAALATVPAAKRRFVPTSGTYPLGFAAGTARAGVKPSSTGADVALVAATEAGATGGFAGAAVFTRNAFAAAPVQESRAALKATGGRGVRAVVVNSGCANAVTGKGGAADAAAMAGAVDGVLGTEKGALVMSTGVIGQRYVCSQFVEPI
jgi:glutamate N-acetyltransferase/amino-acid N-acetyltransferase